jgi:hypothetical protein
LDVVEICFSRGARKRVKFSLTTKRKRKAKYVRKHSKI